MPNLPNPSSLSSPSNPSNPSKSLSSLLNPSSLEEFTIKTYHNYIGKKKINKKEDFIERLLWRERERKREREGILTILRTLSLAEILTHDDPFVRQLGQAITRHIVDELQETTNE